MHTKVTTLLILLLAGKMLHAQSDPGIYSARMHGLAGISATLKQIDAVYGNPAGTATLPKLQAHLGSAQSFGLSPLTQVNAAATFQTGEHSVLSARAGQFGFDAYNERQISIGYAMELSEQFSAGLRFDGYQFSIEQYGSAFLPGVTLGIQYALGESLSFGAIARNPVRIATHEAIELPTVLTVGMAYTPAENISFHGEIEKDIDFQPRLRFAAEYQLIDALVIRAGGGGNPGAFHAGAGFIVRKSLRIDLAAGYHNQLGFTPALGLAFVAE